MCSVDEQATITQTFIDCEPFGGDLCQKGAGDVSKWREEEIVDDLIIDELSDCRSKTYNIILTFQNITKTHQTTTARIAVVHDPSILAIVEVKAVRIIPKALLTVRNLMRVKR